MPSSYPTFCRGCSLLPADQCTSRGSEDAHNTGLVPRRGLTENVCPCTPSSLPQPLSKVPVMAWECSAVCCDGLECLFIFSLLCDMNWRGYADCGVTLSLLWHDLGCVCAHKREGRLDRGVCVCVWERDDIPIHACFHLLPCWLHGCAVITDPLLLLDWICRTKK